MENRYIRAMEAAADRLDRALGRDRVFSRTVETLFADLREEVMFGMLDCLLALRRSGSSSRRAKASAVLLQDALLSYYGYVKFSDCMRLEKEEVPVPPETLLHELNSLIGLREVKKQVADLIAFQKMRLARERAGMHVPVATMHLAFLGNPGTGKTTVARIVGRLYRSLGLLSRGQFVEVSRTDLIAGYQGQTAMKVRRVVERARGGVLFIDEAYSLTENDRVDSYGRECLTELTKALEDYREDLVVIVAGYTELMKQFFASNPGLKSRFNTFIEFRDYTSEELFGIFEQLCRSTEYVLDASAAKKIKIQLDEAVREKPKDFSNGRRVRNLYEKTIMRQACRIGSLAVPSVSDLSVITADDVPGGSCGPRENFGGYKSAHARAERYRRACSLCGRGSFGTVSASGRRRAVR